MLEKSEIENALDLLLENESISELINEEQDLHSNGITFEHVDEYRENDEAHVIYFIHDTNLHRLRRETPCFSWDLKKSLLQFTNSYDIILP